MRTRGIRGAVTSEADTQEAILAATRELLQAILATNPDLETEDIASVFFTVTDDLSAIHPALAARQLGWTDVPLLCAREIPVPGSLPRTIRVLLHWNTELPQAAIHHVYLGDAAVLRPDHHSPHPGPASKAREEKGANGYPREKFPADTHLRHHLSRNEER